ncbi:MAG: site-specific DNA-methyltransferase [FCB group bacterium]|nr:site-specific DNA-methyltransferase [FCB group bacterium]
MIVPLIKAGSSERGVCPVCRAAWVRVVERETVKRKRKTPSGEYITGSGRGWNKEINENAGVIATTTGWKPSCTCQQNGATPEPIPALVIDPFVGSGTTLEVARSLGRDAIGFDLSYPYLATQARERLGLRALAEWGNGKLTASVREGLKVWDEEGGAAALESLPLFGGA